MKTLIAFIMLATVAVAQDIPQQLPPDATQQEKVDAINALLLKVFGEQPTPTPDPQPTPVPVPDPVPVPQPDPEPQPQPEPGPLLPVVETNHGPIPVPAFGDFEVIDDTTVASEDVFVRENIIVRGRLVINGVVGCRNIFGLPGSHIIINDGADITFLDLPIAVDDPGEWGNGMVILGKLDVIGFPKTEYATSQFEPTIGDTSLTLATVPQNWQVGDQLYIPDTRGGVHRQYAQVTRITPGIGGAEYLTIQSIQGNTVTFTNNAGGNALLGTHRGGRNSNNEVEFFPHVFNLSRSINFRSENPSGTRGHIAFLDRAEVSFENAGVHHMGRTVSFPLEGQTNVRGRYPIHAHHLIGPVNATGPQFAINGNVIIDNYHTKWGLTIHGSSYGEIRNNIVHSIGGPGIVTENGSEVENTFTGNAVIQNSGKGDTDDMKGARRRDGFWLRGVGNTFDDNVVYGSGGGQHGGYTMYMQVRSGRDRVLIPAGPGQHPTIPIAIYLTPLKSFERNQSWCFGRQLEIWDLMGGGEINIAAMNGSRHYGGIFIYRAENMHYRDCKLFGERAYKDAVDAGMSYPSLKYLASAVGFHQRDKIKPRITNMEISGFVKDDNFVEGN